ncbi:MAG: sulfotransferase [Gemmatimonadetes bacterium]|nr:MAG: sulfotransferase [Gemmatimonadota bacterium]
MNSSPIFISLLYRSGSTVLILALGQSPQIKISYDTVHFMRFSYGKYHPIAERFPELLADTFQRVKERRGIELKLDQIESAIRRHEVITEGVVYDEIMRSFLDLKPGERWLDRTAVKWESIPHFLNMFPQGKVIHTYRDPRAVLASYKKMTYHPGLMYMDSIFASLAMFNFIGQESIRNHPQIYLLKYENLVANPEHTLKSVCDFLEIDFIPQMLDVSSFQDQLGNPFDGNSSHTGNRATIDSTTAHLWQNTLSPIEIYLTEMVLKDKLKTYGYDFTGIDLNSEEWYQLYDMLHTDFLHKRYRYWLTHGDGVQAYPDTPGAYEEPPTQEDVS